MNTDSGLPTRPSASQPATPARPGRKPWRWFVLAGVLAIIAWYYFLGRVHEKPAPAAPRVAIPPPAPVPAPVPPAPTPVAAKPHQGLRPPQPMRLKENVLVQQPWNSGPASFSLAKPPPGQDGAISGPRSVAFLNGIAYVLDNVGHRLLGYDKDGRQVAAIALPNQFGNDLIVEANGAGLLVVDYRNNTVYRVVDNQLSIVPHAKVAGTFPLGTKFAYDATTGRVTAEDIDGLADIRDGKLVLGNGLHLSVEVALEKPVACVEEATIDGQGNLWVLYTLEGDFRTRRLARIDPVSGTIGVAQIDVWFAFDANRRMTATKNGVVILAGDPKEARLLTFDYAGMKP
ncbi:MAG: hypothetical protein HZA31_08335 [Opitutae bacterium]|nr:hypothetical protein [Opitutae bacterium]